MNHFDLRALSFSNTLSYLKELLETEITQNQNSSKDKEEATGTVMNTNKKFTLTIIIVVTILLIAIVASSRLKAAQQKASPTSSAAPMITPTPTPAPTSPTPTATPTPSPYPNLNSTLLPAATPTLSPLHLPTPAQSSTEQPYPTLPPFTPDIQIDYAGQTTQNITDQHGVVDSSSAGKVFLMLNITIRNDGYAGFDTNPAYFYVTANGITYGYDAETSSVGQWNTTDVPKGGTYNGTLIFQIPASGTSFTPSYDYPPQAFLIYWIKVS